MRSAFNFSMETSSYRSHLLSVDIFALLSLVQFLLRNVAVIKWFLPRFYYLLFSHTFNSINFTVVGNEKKFSEVQVDFILLQNVGASTKGSTMFSHSFLMERQSPRVKSIIHPAWYSLLFFNIVLSQTAPSITRREFYKQSASKNSFPTWKGSIRVTTCWSIASWSHLKRCPNLMAGNLWRFVSRTWRRLHGDIQRSNWNG